MAESQEKLEILNMIKDGKITPEQGVKLIEAIEGGGKKGEGAKESPRWLNVEVRIKSSGKYRSLTPIRIPMSLVRLFFRFIPKDSSLPGSESTIEELLDTLEAGKPIEYHSDEGEEGRSVRISVE